MLYTYTCEKCRWHGDRLSPIVQRDTQVCGRAVGQAMLVGETTDIVTPVTCDGKLIREEISLTARMGYAWNQAVQKSSG